VLIGDPKQAIYAFRGADVVTYLQATESAQLTSTLGINWRSDKSLVDALQSVMGGVAFGDPRIRVHDVDAAQPGRTLREAPQDRPLRIRGVPRCALGKHTNALLGVDQVRLLVAEDIAADIMALLSSGAKVVEGGAERSIQPADIAVLVQRNEDGRTVRDAVAARDIPVVQHVTSSVFSSDAAGDWLTLLSSRPLSPRAGFSSGCSPAMTGSAT
jgi:exodeoxyribonuclease V beta subunit